MFLGLLASEESMMNSPNFRARILNFRGRSLSRGHSTKSTEAVHVVVTEEVVGLVGGDDEQSKFLDPKFELMVVFEFFFHHGRSLSRGRGHSLSHGCGRSLSDEHHTEFPDLNFEFSRPFAQPWPFDQVDRGCSCSHH